MRDEGGIYAKDAIREVNADLSNRANSLVVLTWNAEGMTKDAAEVLIDRLQLDDFKWDVLLIQEGPASDDKVEGILGDGHAWFVAPKCERPRSVAILLHREFYQRCEHVHFIAINGRTAYLSLKFNSTPLFLITAHAPHSLSSETEFDSFLSSLADVVDVGKNSKARLIFGIDANAVLGSQHPSDDPRVVGTHGAGVRNCRGHVFGRWLHDCKLTAANTLFRKRFELMWTHRLHASGSLRQIDFLLGERDCRGRFLDCKIVHSLDGLSDHRAVAAWYALLASSSAKRTSKTPGLVSWQTAKDKDEIASYHAALDRELDSVDGTDVTELSKAVVRAARSEAVFSTTLEKKRSPELLQLLQSRQQAADDTERKHLSKQIWRLLRKERRERLDKTLSSLIERGNIKAAMSASCRLRPLPLTAIRSMDNTRVTDRAGIVEVFASFYEQLYAAVASPDYVEKQDHPLPIPRITEREVDRALRTLKNNKCCDMDGLVAEMLKQGNHKLRTVIADAFTDILGHSLVCPTEWKKAKMNVLFKKGDAELPQNYRPVSIISIMAKLFSKIIYLRLHALVEDGLPDEQYGFRANRGCSDPVYILRQIAQKSEEWGLPLWAATLDAEKAFDCVDHNMLFEALMNEGAHFNIVSVLRNLYSDMQAYVSFGTVSSRLFPICRGVRQGDPLSPLLFLVIMKYVFQDISKKWTSQNFGTEVGKKADGQKLLYIAFADDVTLLASSWQALCVMLKDVHEALEKFGLRLHPTKCKAQGNAFAQPILGTHQICAGFSIEVVAAEMGFIILGTKLALASVMEAELEHRISMAWRKFHSLKAILLHRDASVTRRLQAFDATVGSCFLWCSESWSLRKEDRRKIQSALNDMLRRILGVPRLADDDWVSWVQRATRRARAVATTAGTRWWVEGHMNLKTKWAKKVSEADQGSWLWNVTVWRDSMWQQVVDATSRRYLRRSRTGPWLRWEGDLVKLAKTKGKDNWMLL